MKPVLIIGAGYMGKSYAQVLQAFGREMIIFGRGAGSAEDFHKTTGVEVVTDNNKKMEILNKKNIDYAIVASDIETLFPVTEELIKRNIKNILLEKPGGASISEVEKLVELSDKSGTNIFIAYNRRFYSSVYKAQEIIAEDGGVDSFLFEFTEWGHTIRDDNFPKRVLKFWLMSNPSHVIDMAFFMGGKPKEISCFSSGSVDWHPEASVFSGAGITEDNKIFSYHANWDAPGRWGVEILTKKNRLIFKPLEELQIQKIRTVKIEKVDVDDSLDKKFKPGIYKQTEAFLDGKPERFLTIKEYLNNIKSYYVKIHPALENN